MQIKIFASPNRRISRVPCTTISQLKIPQNYLPQNGPCKVCLLRRWIISAFTGRHHWVLLCQIAYNFLNPPPALPDFNTVAPSIVMSSREMSICSKALYLLISIYLGSDAILSDEIYMGFDRNNVGRAISSSDVICQFPYKNLTGRPIKSHVEKRCHRPKGLVLVPTQRIATHYVTHAGICSLRSAWICQHI